MNIVFSPEPGMVIQLISAMVLPLVVGLVTSRLTAGSTKAWLLAGLTLLTSIFTQMGDAVGSKETFDIGVALVSAIPAFTISVASYYGLWKPTGVGEAAQDVHSTTLFE